MAYVDPKTDRRRFARVTLLQPLKGRIGSTTVFVVDASLCGFRIAHQDALPPVGGSCTLEFVYEGARLKFHCTVKRTTVEKQAKTQFDKTLYHSGIEIVESVSASEGPLRQMIQQHVARALDEQRANARGIPAIAAQSFQTGKASTDFIRCEFLAGKWKVTRTTSSDQPRNGFTVSGDEEDSKVEMLRSAFESADTDGRNLIRTFAALSISKAEGIPTRRYTP